MVVRIALKCFSLPYVNVFRRRTDFRVFETFPGRNKNLTLKIKLHQTWVQLKLGKGFQVIAKNIIFDSWVKKRFSVFWRISVFFYYYYYFMRYYFIKNGIKKYITKITVMQTSIQCTRNANKRKQDAILNKTIKLVFMLS